ncbi:MAG: DUF4446 family protein [Actinobacteria bacterium]|nr:DUF4446 family protein [Actinomycetota bacterium]
MRFTDTALSVLVLISLGLSVLAVLLLLLRMLRDRRVRDPADLPPGERLEALVTAHARSIRRLEAAVRQLAMGERRLGEFLEGAVQHVGVVRFDAFEDMGGRLSFSAALLDGRGDGVVITSINGRQDTRCYAKRVENGTSIHNLSDEEEQAIREAMGGPSRIVEAS